MQRHRENKGGQMYMKGDLKIGKVFDSETETDDDCNPIGPDTGYWAHLPHACDQWVIGGRQQVKDLIDDLAVGLEKLPEETEEP